MEEEKVLAKLRKLLALAARGGTEHEASAAAAAAQRLATAHQLDLAEISLEDPTLEEPMSLEADPLDPELNTRRYRDHWRGTLVSWLAKANGCIAIWQGANILLGGTPSACNSVRYLYAYLVREIQALALVHATGRGKGYSNGWKKGCADRVGARVAWASREASEGRNPDAIVKVQTRLEAFEASLNLGRLESHPPNPDGYDAGFQAGADIALASGPALEAPRERLEE